jgi:hypothetical protein
VRRAPIVEDGVDVALMRTDRFAIGAQTALWVLLVFGDKGLVPPSEGCRLDQGAAEMVAGGIRAMLAKTVPICRH